MNNLDIQISGMTCTACSSRIEKALLRMDGVKEASVSLATSTANVQWDGKTGAEEILGRIHKLGYGANRRVQTELPGFQFEARDYRNRFLISLVLSAPLFMVMLGHWFEALSTITPDLFFHSIFQLVLGSILIAYMGSPFYAGAYYAIKQGMPNMDVLVAFSISGAYLYSQYHVFRSIAPSPNGHSQHEFYFDSIAMVLTAITLGKWMEAIAKGNALRSLTSLYKLRSESAIVIRTNGTKETVPIEELWSGTLIFVASGEGIPTDGIIMDGIADMEESLLTGESLLVKKKPGDSVFAGTTIASGQLVVQASTGPSDTLLSRMISFVEEAQRSKPRIQRRVDLIAAYFVPVILMIAAITYFAWVNLSKPTEAFNVAMAVLLVACPCALGLATPVSILIGSGMAARAGIIFKEGSMFETLSRANSFIFDKTGTLTEGKPSVTNFHSKHIPALKMLKLAASLERYSDHPFARAIVKEAQANGLVLSPVSEIKEFPGRGITGVVDHCRMIIGHSHWLEELGYKVTEEERIDAKLHIVLEDKVAGSISFGDPLREKAKTTLSWLGKNAQLWLASGDGESAAKSIAARIGITNMKSRMTPAEKLALVHQLQKQGRTVVMVGDGANDSAALSAANVGMALAGGNNAAMQSGDIVIVGGRITGVRDAFEIANRTMRNIRQNLGLALLYNAVMIPLAVLGMLDPRTACISMASSSILVVGNALRLQRIPIVRLGRV